MCGTNTFDSMFYNQHVVDIQHFNIAQKDMLQYKMHL